MNVPTVFIPIRRRGLIFQIGVSLILLLMSGLSVWEAVDTEEGLPFVLFLAVALIFFAPVPVLVYRIYGLARAYYQVDRDGVRLRWGLRAEDISLFDVEWVRLATDLPTLYEKRAGQKPARLSLPWLHWPGSLMGARNLEGLGPVEFLASEPENLVLIATPQRIYAISPSDPVGFMRTFDRITELGSLAPLKSHSIYPTFLLSRIWTDRLARILLIAGFLLGLALLVWVGLILPSRPTIPLGFTPQGLPGESGPVERLVLLPVLAGLTYVLSFIGGLFFYRRPDWQPVAYLLWGGTIVEIALLLVAVGLLSQA